VTFYGNIASSSCPLKPWRPPNTIGLTNVHSEFAFTLRNPSIRFCWSFRPLSLLFCTKYNRRVSRAPPRARYDFSYDNGVPSSPSPTRDHCVTVRCAFETVLPFKRRMEHENEIYLYIYRKRTHTHTHTHTRIHNHSHDCRLRLPSWRRAISSNICEVLISD
jgi:hypothetical protein